MSRIIEKNLKRKKLAEYFVNIISANADYVHPEEIDGDRSEIRVVFDGNYLLFIRAGNYYSINVTSGTYMVGNYVSYFHNFNRFGVINKVKFIKIPYVKISETLLDLIAVDLENETDKKITLDTSSELFNLVFEKSKIENHYYFLFMEPKAEISIPLPHLFSEKNSIKLFYEGDYYNILRENLVSMLFYELFINIFCSKLFSKRKNKKQIDLKRIVKFKNPDPKLLASKCTETYKVKKYVPKQNGKVYLEGKSGTHIITNLKYLKNVRNTIKKKNNTIQTPFAWSI